MKNTITPSISALRKTAMELARTIDTEPVETGYVIDVFGNIHGKPYRGTFDSIDIPKIEGGIIAVHNHPSHIGRLITFSGDDIYNMYHNKISEMVICGFGKYYHIKRGNNTTQPSKIRTDLNRINNVLSKKLDKMYYNIPLPSGKDRDVLIKQAWIEYKNKYLDEYNRAANRYLRYNGFTIAGGRL